jgi:hypothetical protein
MGRVRSAAIAAIFVARMGCTGESSAAAASRSRESRYRSDVTIGHAAGEFFVNIGECLAQCLASRMQSVEQFRFFGGLHFAVPYERIVLSVQM